MEHGEPVLMRDAIIQVQQEGSSSQVLQEETGVLIRIVDSPDSFVGKLFDSYEEAVHFYTSHALAAGFSIRLDEARYRHGSGGIRRRDIVCHRQGVHSSKRLAMPTTSERQRMSGRCGCKAMVRMQIDEIAGIEKWMCVQHISEYNHHLLSAQEVRQLPAYRCISPEEKGRIRMCKEAGMTVNVMMNLMRIEANKSLSFTATDVRNYLASTGETTSHDTQELLKTLKDKHEQDPEFFYTFTVDCEGRLEHLLWIHSQTRGAALYFGDVIIFDTTYKLNKYDMPFAVFTGVSNHGQTLLLGAALLRNETTPTFQWLFEEWHKTMRVNPVSILTDQDRSITEAICSKLPTTKHCFCTWHITSKFPGWFAALLKEEFESFMRDFRRTWKVETVEEFESVWVILIDQYKLTENRHIKDLFQLWEYWCPVWTRGYFTAGMTTTQRSESINRFMDYFMGTQTKLHEFVDAFDKAMDKRADSMITATTREKLLLPKLSTTFPMEKKASERFSHYAFQKFQKELILSAEYVFQDGKVSHFQHPDIERSVTYDAEKKLVQCSSLMFESTGILCRHALRVLNIFNVLELPDSYILRRWEKDLGPTSLHREYIRFQEEKEFSGSEVEKWKYMLLLKTRSIAFYASTSSSCLRDKIDIEFDKLLEMVTNEANMAEGSNIVDHLSTVSTAPRKKRSMRVEEKLTSNQNSVLVDKALVVEVSSSDSDDSDAFTENPPRCKTKGRPKSARAKSAVEKLNGRQPQLCRICNLKVIGHDSRNCPEKKKNQPQ